MLNRINRLSYFVDFLGFSPFTGYLPYNLLALSNNRIFIDNNLLYLLIDRQIKNLLIDRQIKNIKLHIVTDIKLKMKRKYY